MEKILKNKVVKPIACDLCGYSRWKPMGSKLMICIRCKLVRANYKYTNANYCDLYQHDYYFGSEYGNYLRDRVALEKNFNERLRFLISIGSLKKDTRLIEIGSAYGFFLNMVKDNVKKCIGFDVSKEGTTYSRKQFNVDARCVDFLSYKGQKADTVVMWDVIEHLPNPNEYIKKVSSKLEVGGVLSLTTGDMGSILSKIQGEKWRLIHPPTHLFYFDRNTLTSLLAKNGLMVVDVRYSAIYRNLGSMLEQLSINSKLSAKMLHFVQKVIPFHKINLCLNLYDIFQFTAVKI